MRAYQKKVPQRVGIATRLDAGVDEGKEHALRGRTLLQYQPLDKHTEDSMPKSHKVRRAMEQQVRANWSVVTKGAYLAQPSKAELRASVPSYDELMVRRIEAKPKGKKRGIKR
jgi:hypothetical protein